ncbi:MAG TPA: hypothetical protein VEC37_11685 [Bacillota bacterium]|nr:hypothetical protein [Bacillota bacterium]
MKKWVGSGLLLLVIMSLGLTTTGNCAEYPTPRLRVFIKDEGFHEKNIVKPRIYVENIGRQTVHNFDLYYFFTAERGKTPVIETYYVPNGRVTLERENRREYVVRYRFRNIRLEPGEAFPDRNGCVIGIHYTDWSDFIKENDYSDPGTPNWRLTRKVNLEVSETFRR